MIALRRSGRMTSTTLTATCKGLRPSVLMASLSARGGLNARISSNDTPCQIGIITLPVASSLAVRPRNSYSGHGFDTNERDTTTKPNLDLDSPISILLLRLSPIVNENLSYQTVTPN